MLKNKDRNETTKQNKVDDYLPRVDCQDLASIFFAWVFHVLLFKLSDQLGGDLLCDVVPLMEALWNKVLFTAGPV